MPNCLKRTHDAEDGEDQLQTWLKKDFYMTVMLAVSQKDLPKSRVDKERIPANEWVGRSELKVLRKLLDLPIVSARWHHELRKRMQKPPNSKDRKRIRSVFCWENSLEWFFWFKRMRMRFVNIPDVELHLLGVG